MSRDLHLQGRLIISASRMRALRLWEVRWHAQGHAVYNRWNSSGSPGLSGPMPWTSPENASIFLEPVQIPSFPILLATPELNVSFLSWVYSPDKARLQCISALLLYAHLFLFNRTEPSAAPVLPWLFLLPCHCLYSSLCLECPPLPVSTGQSPYGSSIVCLTKHIIDSVVHSRQTLMTERTGDLWLLRLGFLSASGHFVALLGIL